MPTLNTASDVKLGETQVLYVFVGQVRVWPNQAEAQPLVFDISSDGTLFVIWQEINGDLYELRRNGELIATVTSRFYADSGLDWDEIYYYTVTPIVSGVPGDESPPSINAYIPSGYISKLTPSNRTYESVTVSWEPVPGADEYWIYRNDFLYKKTASTSKVIETEEDITITVSVIPYRNGVAGNTRVDQEPVVNTYYSGRRVVKDQGSKSNMIFKPALIDSWRSSDAWAWLTNTAAQGHQVGESSAGDFRGVIYYSQNGVRGELRTELGGPDYERQLQGTCTSAELYLFKKKKNTYPDSAVKVNIKRSDSNGQGGMPSGQGSIIRTSTRSDKGDWISISREHGQALGDGDSKSLLIMNDGSNNHALFSDCRLKLSWSWNYVKIKSKDNTWQ